MDLLRLEDLQFLDASSLLLSSISIPRLSPRTFSLITLSLIFPLSFAILAHTLFTHPLLLHLRNSSTNNSSNYYLSLLLLYQFLYLLFLFTFSLLSTSAVVFTVASLLTSKPVSFSLTLSAIPPIFPRLFKTFLWISLLMLLYNLFFALSLLILLLLLSPSNINSPSFLLPLSLTLLLFLFLHVYISSLWHLASVVSVLEPVCGLSAIRKSRHLLSGNTRTAFTFVAAYIGICGTIGAMFRSVVVKGSDEGGAGIGLMGKVLVGGALVAVLVVVNLVGLLVQSVFYYVCKGYHNQEIDKGALGDHLGGYLGEYVPLKSSIQMESL